MTVTDEIKLREMLDERGIPWRETISGHTGWETEHGDDAVTMGADAGLVMLHAWVTPEEAIRATLGPGTCHIDTMSANGMSCSKCGKRWANYMVAFSNDPLFGSGYARTSPNFCPNCGAKVVV